MKSYWLAGPSILAALRIAVGVPPVGAIDCGDVLAGPGSFQLERDLTCSTPTALTVRDGARLDLGRHTVTCAQGGTGVAVAGTEARLTTGVVTGCGDGVVLAGAGHVVRHVRATFNGQGFRAAAELDDARLSDNLADFNAAGGFRILGNGNALRDNVAFGNGDVAFFVVGNGNVVSENHTNGNCIIGDCAAAYVLGGHDNRVTRNLAIGEGTGFLLMAGGGTSGNQLFRNSARFVFRAGLVVEEGATGNRLRRNAVRGGGIHLVDRNPACDANVWQGNMFDTRNQPCIE